MADFSTVVVELTFVKRIYFGDTVYHVKVNQLANQDEVHLILKFIFISKWIYKFKKKHIECF